MSKKFTRIYVEITNYCNLSCSFCSKDTREKKEMTVDEFRSVISKIKDYTENIYLHVKGEPLLHSHFDEILSICDENNVNLKITTNGTLLAKRKDILLKHNIKQIEQKNKNIKTILGNAKDLSMIDDNTYDLTLLFGPMYHLISEEEKLQALKEAKRITKKDGIIMIAYCMNDYAIITHGFIDNNIKEALNKNEINESFHVTPKPTDLYSRLTLEEINELNKKANLKRIKIISPDGPANYIRKQLNKMDDETYDLFIKYHLSTCERMDLIGAGAHTLDIIKND